MLLRNRTRVCTMVFTMKRMEAIIFKKFLLVRVAFWTLKFDEKPGARPLSPLVWTFEIELNCRLYRQAIWYLWECYLWGFLIYPRLGLHRRPRVMLTKYLRNFFLTFHTQLIGVTCTCGYKQPLLTFYCACMFAFISL